MIDAVTDWRTFLSETAAFQAVVRAECAGLAIEEHVERAAARYLPLALEITGCEDAWYNTFALMVRWHVESCGAADRRVGALIADLVSGAFHSWVAPREYEAAELATDLGLRVGELLAARDDGDALARWWSVRDRVRWPALPRHAPALGAVDGHRAFIARHDATRSAERARRMSDALTFVRAEARAQWPLSWGMLREAQRRVLGVAAVEFRAGDAFAKGGRERYGLAADTGMLFERCLRETTERALSPANRAARVYLDVCFAHPFDDGNARAARLALDHVLTSAGLALRGADAVFLLPRYADDAAGAASLGYLVDHLTGPA